MITLRLFGGASLESGQSPITGRSAQRRRIAVLALLAVARRGLTRDKVIGYIWADNDAEKARRLLSESLYVLRKELGEDAILASGDDLRLNPAVVDCDVTSFEDALEAGDFDRVAELYTGPFLDGFYVSDALELEHWIESERTRLARAYRTALERLAEQAGRDGRHDDAVNRWRKLIEQDPFSGRYTLGLMQALDAAGHRAAALRHARTHATLLREELDAEPDPDVEALAERLREAPEPSRLASVGDERTAVAQAATSPADEAAAGPYPAAHLKGLAEAGTVTFLFSDIEGSTALLRRLGPRYAELLTTHHGIIRACVRECHGREIDNAGDGFFIVFPRARDGLAAAIRIQRALADANWPEGVAVRVRMGLHTGEPALTLQGYVGLDVHRAARICGAARGGQILMSVVTRELLAGDVPEGADINDEGMHSLKDLEQPEHLYSLVLAGVTLPLAPQRKPVAAPSASIPVGLGPPVPVTVATNRSWLRLAVPAGMLLFVLVALGVMLRRPAAQPPDFVRATPADMTQVAIFPFAVAGDERIQWLRVGLARLLAGKVDGVAGLRATDGDALFAAIGEDAASPTLAERIARRFDARLILLGNATSLGDGRIAVNVQMYDLEATENPRTRATAVGSDTNLDVLVNELVTQLLADWVGGSTQVFARIRGLSSDSINANRMWIEGELHFAASRYDRAVRAFTRATEIDPSFAIAHYRLSMAAEWDLKFNLVKVHAERARRAAGGLPAHYRDLIDAWTHIVYGRADEALRIYRTIVGQRPEEAEAWYGLGEAIVHFNPLRGRSNEEARTNFAHVLELVPDLGDARYHLMEFAAADHDAAAFDSLMAGVDPQSKQWPAWQAVRAFGFGTDADRTRVERMLSDRTSRTQEDAVGVAAVRVAANQHRFEDALGVTAILARSRDPDYQAIARLVAANLHYASGRYRDAMASLSDASPLEPAWSYELRALFTLPAFLPVSRDELLAARDSLALINPGERGSRTAFVLGVHAFAHTLLRHYLTGMVNVRLGDLSAAVANLAGLERIQTELESSLKDGLVASLDAHIRLARGEREDALRRLAATRLDANIEQAAISPFYSRAYDRLVIADLQREAGNDTEAIRWYRSLIEGYDLLYVAPAHYRLSQIYSRLGQADTAALHRGRFDRLWRNADAEVKAALTDEPSAETR